MEDTVTLTDLAPDPGADHGEVFTRRWVVDLILDLVGYTPDKDLGGQLLVEPSCGTGAFLIPIVERLIASTELHQRDLRSLTPAIQAFDLLGANTERARKAVVELLTDRGVSDEESSVLAEGWVTTGDFLLKDQDLACADYVVGNPPYIRLESVPRDVMDAYRSACSTMRGRADIYMGFLERGLGLLREGGALSFICADRWMRNQYGAGLRELITTDYAVETVISMHDVDAFEDEVSAYPAIVVLRNKPQAETAVVGTNGAFSQPSASRLSSWIGGTRGCKKDASFEATRVDGWFAGRDLWPAGSPSQLALIADLEARFAPLQDEVTGTVVGIGLATGCDEVYITDDPHKVEDERLLPLVQSSDITAGNIRWPGTYLVNPWGEDGLVNLDDFPRLKYHLELNEPRLRQRFVARRRPQQWYRTIDRVNSALTARPKLLLPDMKATAHPVLDSGGYYPHHNLYFVTSQGWNLEVLGGLLLSEFANLFVGAYCVKMRGGCYRFQAQYLRRIRVPDPSDIDARSRRALATAFTDRDVETATAVATTLYGVDPPGQHPKRCP